MDGMIYAVKVRHYNEKGAVNQEWLVTAQSIADAVDRVIRELSSKMDDNIGLIGSSFEVQSAKETKYSVVGTIGGSNG